MIVRSYIHVDLYIYIDTHFLYVYIHIYIYISACMFIVSTDVHTLVCMGVCVYIYISTYCSRNQLPNMDSALGSSLGLGWVALLSPTMV